jgi:hypothetical protein
MEINKQHSLKHNYRETYINEKHNNSGNNITLTNIGPYTKQYISNKTGLWVTNLTDRISICFNSRIKVWQFQLKNG